VNPVKEISDFVTWVIRRWVTSMTIVLVFNLEVGFSSLIFQMCVEVGSDWFSNKGIIIVHSQGYLMKGGFEVHKGI